MKKMKHPILRQAQYDGRQQTGDGRQQTADGRRQTADGRQQMADGRQQTGDGRQKIQVGNQKTEAGSRKPEVGSQKTEAGSRNDQYNFSDITIGTLYIVPTPIGNLDDITLRAIKVLSEADIIACEDTRHTGMLLKNLSIVPIRLVSYHEHNEKTKSVELLEEIISGKTIALVSDAGSPLISDPGFPLIRLVTEHNIKIIALPGATAFVPALSASGFPSNKFVFLGFAPQKKGRMTFLKELLNIEYTSILYESSHRIIKLLDELNELLGETRQICVAREISKIHEDYIRGTALNCKDILINNNAVKGEFVVIIDDKNNK